MTEDEIETLPLPLSADDEKEVLSILESEHTDHMDLVLCLLGLRMVYSGEVFSSKKLVYLMSRHIIKHKKLVVDFFYDRFDDMLENGELMPLSPPICQRFGGVVPCDECDARDICKEESEPEC